MTSLFGDDFNITINSKSNIKELLKKTGNNKEEDKEALDKVLKSNAISLKERLAIITEKVLTVLGKQRKNILVIKDKETLHNYISDCIKAGRIDIDTETNNSLDPVTCKLMGPCFYAPGLKQAYVPLNHVNPDTMERLPWQLTEQDIHDELQRVVEAKTMIIMHNGKFDYEVIKCTCNIEVAPNWDTIIAAKLIDENEFKEGRAGLKYIYTTYIDPTQAKYDIENLFENVQYSMVDPDIFALYAATDAMMTDKVYLWQKPFMEKPENSKIKWVFENIEMPIVVVTAEMELTGVAIDTNFGNKLKLKYDAQLEALDNKIEQQMIVLREIIKFWKTLPSANKKTRAYQPKKTKLTMTEIQEKYPYFDTEVNKYYKIGKCRADQIGDDISLTSPVQLAILFYDILGCPAVSKKSPRGTGENEIKLLAEELKKPKKIISKLLEQLSEDIRTVKEAEYNPTCDTSATEIKVEQKQESMELLFADYEEFESEETIEDSITGQVTTDIPKISVAISAAMTSEEINKLLTEAEELYTCGLDAAQKLCQTILDRRGIVKLVSTYIDVIPELTKHWPDGRIRFHLNSMGTDTGRYSSGGKLKFIENGEPVVVSGINIQNIPSHNKEIRMLFRGQIKEEELDITDNQCYELPEISEIETSDGWKFGKDLVIGDKLITEDGLETVKSINYINKTYYLYV